MNLRAFLPQPAIHDPSRYPHKVTETFDLSDKCEHWRLDRATALARQIAPCDRSVRAGSGQVVWSFERQTDAMEFCLRMP